MTMTVGEMTTAELREMIEFIVEHKLREVLGDPDEGLQLRDEIAVRLERQRAAVAAGERGTPLSTVLSELGLD